MFSIKLKCQRYKNYIIYIVYLNFAKQKTSSDELYIHTINKNLKKNNKTNIYMKKIMSLLFSPSITYYK